ncbi:MAG: cation:proton antiporter [Candidatus Woesearchaeota archaeon]
MELAPHAFVIALLALGGVLVLAALASGLAARSFLSLTAMAVVLGFVLGPGATGVLSFRAGSAFVGDLATVALVVILFRDGLEVEWEMLQDHWRLPVRNLVLAMPITALIVAVAARLIGHLSWTEAFLLGALLSPTDPVLSSSVVTNPRVPRVIRHSLNLESGMNDGLALPAVLALIAALSSGSSHFVWWRFVLENVSLGLVWGVAVGFLAAWAMPRDHRLESAMPAHQRALYALGVGFVLYGTELVPPHGNGLIAVYVGAITLGIRRPDVRSYFEHQSENLVEIVKIGVFLVFGSLLTFHSLFLGGWGAVGIVAVTLLLARPVAVFIALVRTRTDFATRAFISWFGPKGVATIAFSLLVLTAGISSGERIFDYAALVVFCSIILHGVTDTAGADWIARHSERSAKHGSGEDDAGEMEAGLLSAPGAGVPRHAGGRGRRASQ